jgi:quercetin dioxygenase-like cupin family protein
MNTIIKPIAFVILIISGVAFASCNNNKNQEEMKEQNNTSLFPQGEKLSSEWFTGNAYLQPLLVRDKNKNFALGSVTFEPGARTRWHTHPRGQVLIVTEGEGFYQEKGKPAQRIKKGDVINIPENAEHWHGATANTKVIHIAVTNYKGDENVTWLKPVTDREFSEANK